MGQKLQKTFFTIFLSVSIFLIWNGFAVVSAQISLESEAPFELRFSQGETIRDQFSYTVGLSDIESVLSPGFTLSKTQWMPFGEQDADGANYYLSEGNNSAAPGRIQIENYPYQTFFVSSFINNSGSSIGNLLVAFDFVYNFYEREDDFNLSLRYKINEDEWKSTVSGIIETAVLQSPKDAWSSFSIQLNLNDIFLRESDTIHLMWAIDGTDSASELIPMALQRMEIIPDKVDQKSLQRGDVVITEVLPGSNINGSDFEYIELYNPGESPVSLKGVELKSSMGSVVIQRDLLIEPYNFAVISNVDISSLEGVDNSYFYNGSIIAENGGRIEIERNDVLIASATFEVSEQGVALELISAAHAYDGYSSLKDFIPSQTSYFQDLFGSPGLLGSTRPMFRKELRESGFYLLSFPGSLIKELNRHASLELFAFDGNPVTIESIQPNEPVVVYKPDDEPLRIYIEGGVNQSLAPAAPVQLTSSSAIVTTPAFTGAEEGVQQKGRRYFQAAPLTQAWNPKYQKFELLFSDQAELNIWKSYIVHRSVSEVAGAAENAVSTPILDRFIEFSLVTESGNSRSNADRAILGFMDSPAQNKKLRYDLPKVKLDHSTLDGRHSHIYLTSSRSQENYNSFMHLPFEIDEEYEIGVGLDMVNNTGSATIKWNLKNDIPDEWVVLLEDTFNGTTVDLRETNEYRFRYTDRSDVTENIEDDTPKISSVSPQERPRFILTVQPYEAFVEQPQEEEKPDSIELRPNYPNPFNPSTNINFYLPEERAVRVGIYNIVGQQVALLLDDTIQQGEHSLVWDASDKPSGIYIVQLETGNRIFTRKITLIK